jgi:hypothetical protein
MVMSPALVISPLGARLASVTQATAPPMANKPTTTSSPTGMRRQKGSDGAAAMAPSGDSGWEPTHPGTGGDGSSAWPGVVDQPGIDDGAGGLSGMAGTTEPRIMPQPEQLRTASSFDVEHRAHFQPFAMPAPSSSAQA